MEILLCYFPPLKDSEAALEQLLVLVACLLAVGFCGGIFLWIVPRSSWSKGLEFGEVLPATTQLTCFANAWRQFCFAEPALAEHLLKGIQKPLCL